LLLFMASCQAEDDGGMGDDDTIAEPEPPICAVGFHPDPDLPAEFLEDFPDGCVPQECGIGRWGNLEVGGDTVFVDVYASDGGDGSEQAPFTGIQDGLDAAGGDDGGRVAVAAGTYFENIGLTAANRGAHLTGRCRALVVVDGSDGGAYESGITASAGFSSDAEWRISGLTVTGAPYGGITAHSGYLAATTIAVAGNRALGVGAHGRSSQVILTDVEILDTQPLPDGTFGRGIHIQDGARLEVYSSLISGNTEMGISASFEAEVILRDVEVRNTQSLPDGSFGRGIEVQEGARMEVYSSLISENTDVGISASLDAYAVLQDVEVWSTRSLLDGLGGRGIELRNGARMEARSCRVSGNTHIGFCVSGGARLAAYSCLVSGNTAAGILATDPGTEVVLHDVEVLDTQPGEDGTFGRGIEIQEGARMEARSCRVCGNAEIGIIAIDDGTDIALLDVEVWDTRRVHSMTVAGGVASQDDAELFASDLLVSGTEGPGLCATSRASIHCSGCELPDNTFAGAMAWNGGALDLSDTTISGTRPDANEGGGVGIYAWDRRADTTAPASLTIDTVTIEDQPFAAVWLDDDGSYSIVDSTLVGGYGYEEAYPDGTSRIFHGDGIVATGGVSTWNGSRGLFLQGNEIRDAYRAGVLLDGSTAELAGNTFTGNSADVIWQDCDGVDEPVGLNQVPVVDHCPPYNHHIAPLEFNLYLKEAEPLDREGAVRSAPASFPSFRSSDRR